MKSQLIEVYGVGAAVQLESTHGERCRMVLSFRQRTPNGGERPVFVYRVWEKTQVELVNAEEQLSLALRRRAEGLVKQAGTAANPEGIPAHSLPRNPGTSATQSNPGTGACSATAKSLSELLREYVRPGQPLPWWHPDGPSPRIRKRLELEFRLQDNLADARRERAESGARGLATVFSAGGWRVLRAKMQLFLHGFRLPRRAKRPARIEPDFETMLRLRAALQDGRLPRQFAARGRGNGTSPTSTTPAPSAE